MAINPLLVITILLCFSLSPLLSQQTERPRAPTFVWIHNAAPESPQRGYLAGLGDTTVLFAPDLSALRDKAPIHTFYPRDIQSLNFRRKGSARNGLLIGFFTGLLGGIIIGEIDKANCERNATAFGGLCGLVVAGGGFLGSVGGGTLGQIIGGLRVNIPINFRKDEFRAQRKRMERFLPQ